MRDRLIASVLVCGIAVHSGPGLLAAFASAPYSDTEPTRDRLRRALEKMAEERDPAEIQRNAEAARSKKDCDAALFTVAGGHCATDSQPPIDAWLKLEVRSAHSELVPVSVVRSSDPVSDSGIILADAKTGTSDENAILMRAPGVLAPGVKQVVVVDDSKLNAGVPQRVCLDGGHTYILEFVSERSTLRASSDGKTQEIPWTRPSADEGSTVIWAGDLDGDGQLDIITEDTSEKGSGGDLYLSSKATAGELFHRVAGWWSSC